MAHPPEDPLAIDGDGASDDRTGANRAGHASGAAGRRRTRPLVVIVAVAVMAAVVVGAVRIVALTGERDDLQADVERTQESLRIARGDAGAQIEQLEGRVDELGGDLDRLTEELATAERDLASARTEIDDLTARLDERRAERDELQEEVAELRAIVDLVGTEVTPMPDLLGVPIGDVEELADELGVRLVVVESQPGNVIGRPGDVIGQLPVADTPLVPGSVVWVEVYTPAPDEA